MRRSPASLSGVWSASAIVSAFRNLGLGLDRQRGGENLLREVAELALPLGGEVPLDRRRLEQLPELHRGRGSEQRRRDRELLHDRVIGRIDVLAMLELEPLLSHLLLGLEPLPRVARLADQISTHRRADGDEEAGHLQPEEAAARIASDLLDLGVQLVDLSLLAHTGAAADRRQRVALRLQLEQEGDRERRDEDEHDERDHDRLRQPDPPEPTATGHRAAASRRTTRCATTSKWTTDRPMLSAYRIAAAVPPRPRGGEPSQTATSRSQASATQRMAASYACREHDTKESRVSR